METGKQKWIDKAQAQTEKLTALVNALVTLSRMDEGVSPLKRDWHRAVHRPGHRRGAPGQHLRPDGGRGCGVCSRAAVRSLCPCRLDAGALYLHQEQSVQKSSKTPLLQGQFFLIICQIFCKSTIFSGQMHFSVLKHSQEPAMVQDMEVAAPLRAFFVQERIPLQDHRGGKYYESIYFPS